MVCCDLDLPDGSGMDFLDEVRAADKELPFVLASCHDKDVTATVVENGKAKKVIVYKYKRKTGYHKKNGHRPQFTKVKIEKINA